MKFLPFLLVALLLSCTKPGPIAVVRPPQPATRNWIDLLPPMQLRVENAYYREGVPKQGLNGYLGTEIAHYRVQSSGRLRLVSVQPLKDRPHNEPPVQEFLRASERRFRYHRLYYAVVFKRNANARGSVLLGANSLDEVERLTERLVGEPDAVCHTGSAHCTVFPEACSVSLEPLPRP